MRIEAILDPFGNHSASLHEVVRGKFVALRGPARPGNLSGLQLVSKLSKQNAMVEQARLRVSSDQDAGADVDCGDKNP